MPLTAVTNVAVFSGDTIQQRKTVLFVGSPGNVVGIQDELGSDVSQDVDTVIEGAGCTLLPAFIDVEINSRAADSSLESLASFGIATVIDMSSSMAENQAMRAAAADGTGLPTYFACGSVARGPGSRPLPGSQLRSTTVVRTVTEAEAFVAACVGGQDKSDYIKVLVDMHGLDDAVLRALVDAAHRHDRLATAYSTQAAACGRAARAGFDILTHIPVDEPLAPDLVTQLVSGQRAFVPMLFKMSKIASLMQQQQGGDGEGGEEEEEGEEGEEGPRRRPDFAFALDAVRRLHAAGVDICVGTGATLEGDAPIRFGDGFFKEMELLVGAGMSNLEVLRAATYVPARVFRLHDRGRVDSGLRADLVLVEGNPLEDIQALRRIRRIWIKGVEVDLHRGTTE